MKGETDIDKHPLITSEDKKPNNGLMQSMSIEDSEAAVEVKPVEGEPRSMFDSFKGVLIMLLAMGLFTATISTCKYAYILNEHLDGFDYMIFRGTICIISKLYWLLRDQDFTFIKHMPQISIKFGYTSCFNA